MSWNGCTVVVSRSDKVSGMVVFEGTICLFKVEYVQPKAAKLTDAKALLNLEIVSFKVATWDQRY